jgi:hypothetical protein
MKIQALLFFLIFFFGSLEIQAQTMSCQEAMEIVSNNYDYRDNVLPNGSTMLTRATYYTVEGAGYVVAYIKSNQYDLQGRPYIFCGISSQQWAKFKSAGMYGSWGESFHNYIINYTCNCNSNPSQQFNPYVPQTSPSSSSSQFNPYISQSPITNMSPQQREIYYDAKAAQYQQSVVALATLLEAIFTKSPQGRARSEYKQQVKQKEESDKQMEKVLRLIEKSKNDQEVIQDKKKEESDKQMEKVLRLIEKSKNDQEVIQDKKKEESDKQMEKVLRLIREN